MNIKLISLSAAIAASAAFAQNEFAAQPAPAEQTAAPAPVVAQAPAPAPVVASSSSTQKAMPILNFSSSSVAQTQSNTSARFDVVRANAYNTVGNQAAASTIQDNMNSPYKMHGSKLVYFAPTDQEGVVAFGNSSTYFVGFSNSGTLGKLTAGVASSGFGIALRAGLDKSWYKHDNGNIEDDRSMVGQYDDFGLDLATVLAGIDFTVNIDWLTLNDEKHQEIKSNTADEHFFDLRAKATFSNTPSGKNVFWAFSVDLLRHNLTTEVKEDRKDEAADRNSRFEITPAFNIGGTVLGNDKARVLFGLNTRVPVMMFDKIKKDTEDHLGVSVYTKPNIVGEIALGNCWTVFGEVAHTWQAFAYETLTEDDDDEYTAMKVYTYGTTVGTGARFQYNNLAVEASIANGVYNNPLTGFNGGQMVASLGGFFMF